MTKLWVAVMAALLAWPTWAAPFEFSPVPRWAEEPETEVKCAAVKAECPALANKDTIEVEVGYDELYDGDGMLVGLRLTRSTECKPLDEALLLSQRRFKLLFHKDGVPDLDNIHVEVRSGVKPEDVRVVKSSGTSLSLGCN
ncbi:hypothetical protein [Sandarakinorhabdus sp. DWP1-3-1]|uniref:hypothetical protein n=1 Tax=Sandarakinorhabdus sp. DWP1-3-1 TaxID=2804627 RepID=UPI003CFBB6CE